MVFLQRGSVTPGLPGVRENARKKHGKYETAVRRLPLAAHPVLYRGIW